MTANPADTPTADGPPKQHTSQSITPAAGASAPVPPMQICAGGAFHHRKPKQAPVIAAATTARSSGSRTS